MPQYRCFTDCGVAKKRCSPWVLNRCPDLVVSSPPCFMYAMMRSTSRPIYLAKLIDIHPSKRTTKKFRHNSVMDSLLHPGRIARTLRGFRQGSPPFPLHVLACPQLLPRRLLFPPHESYFLDYLDSLRDKDTATSTKVMVLEFSLGFFMFLYCFFSLLVSFHWRDVRHPTDYSLP